MQPLCIGVDVQNLKSYESIRLKLSPFRVAGFLSIALEAPFCCAFVDFIERIAAFSESRAYWQKAALFCGYDYAWKSWILQSKF